MCMLCISIGRHTGKKYTKLLSPDGVIMAAFVFLHVFFSFPNFLLWASVSFIIWRFFFGLFKSGETGKKKAVEKKDLEVMRILVQHLSARMIIDGMVQNEGRIVWMDETQVQR